jgi:hypothetical protein
MTQFELVHKVYNENSKKIEELIQKSKFPKTHTALKNLYSIIHDIRKALEEIEKIQGFYASQGLSRILYEHFLVAYYIFTKCRIDKYDSCGSDYIDYYPIYEMMKRENYNSKLDKTYDAKKTPLQNFLIAAPEFDDLDDPITEADVLDTNKRANKFDIRNILKYMQDDLDPTDAFKSLHSLVHDVCRRYNTTSSYVHGGRLAQLQTFENTPVTDKSKVLRDNSAMAKIFCYQLLSLTILLIATEDEEGFRIYQPIYDFIQAKLHNGG